MTDGMESSPERRRERRAALLVFGQFVQARKLSDFQVNKLQHVGDSFLLIKCRSWNAKARQVAEVDAYPYTAGTRSLHETGPVR